MEDPASRPPAAQLINEVIQDHRKGLESDHPRAGFSLSMKIYLALKDAGWLRE